MALGFGSGSFGCLRELSGAISVAGRKAMLSHLSVLLFQISDSYES